MTIASVPVSPRVGLRAQATAYLSLTKPRIIELLLVTTVPSLVLAAGGWPPMWTAVVTLTAGSFAAGSANALNCFVDRDIDALMARTGRRALPLHQVRPWQALIFGLGLGVLAVGAMAELVNGLSAGLTLAAIAFYVLVYTMGLKRRTSANIVIGGAAGCFPTLIGWAAVRDDIGLPAVVLFLIVFAWTPPHFWALAMRYREDYARANVPMLPVVATDRQVIQQMIGYTWLTVAASLWLIAAAHTGLWYALASVGLGAWFLREVYLLRSAERAGDILQPVRVFQVSIHYLSALFFALAVDRLLR